jgi:hypothetical protein
LSTEDQETTATPAPGRRLALVVGVNGQPVAGRDALDHAVDDALEMEQTLQEAYCGFTLFQRALLGEKATTTHVREAVLNLTEELHDDDFALFYFSGHAEAMLIEGGLDDVYLVTHNFNPKHLKRDPNAHLSLRWLRQVLFEHEAASQVLIILDCCYGGNFGRTAADLYLNDLKQRLKTYFDGPSEASPSPLGSTRFALTASGPRGTALEKNGHGLMTGLMLPALQGLCEQAANENGQIMFTSLFGYLARNGTMPLERQPLIAGTGGDLLLASHPNLSQQTRREREQEVQRAERKQRLREMSTDSSGILHDRLDSFVGREQELADLHKHMNDLLPTGGYLTIRGQAGQGKSSIIAKLIEAYSQELGDPEQVAYHFIPLTPGPDHQVVLLQKLAARLVLKYDLSDLFLAGESRAALSEAFPRILKEIADKGGQEYIFLDGLDQLEAEHTGQRDLSFLPQGPGNPPNGIVFVLGTRPDDILHPLELLKPHIPYDLPNLSRDDFDRILRRRHVILPEHALADRFYYELEENALYLDLVAKELALRDPITPAQVEEIIRAIADNPENLFSLATDRLSQPPEAWNTVIKPILGLLLATSEPLTRQQLKQLVNLNSAHSIDGDRLNRGLERLGGLVVSDGQQRYSLFHLKFRDYLREDAQRPGKRYLFDAEDERGWHKRFIDWCEQSELALIWKNTTDTIEQGRRSYARQHYITHLYHARLWDRLFTILDTGAYGKAKVQHDPSTRSYALDLDLGRTAAAAPAWSLEEAMGHLPHLWRYTLLRCSLASQADRYPLEAFQVMILLGQQSKALGLAELVTNSQQKAAVFTLLASHLASQPEQEREATQLFLRAERVIACIANEGQQVEPLASLASSLAAAQRWQEAERVIACIANEGQQVEPLASLASSLAAAQRWQEAERVITSITDRQQRVEALAALASALAQAQHWQDAERIWQDAEDIIATFVDKDEQVEAMAALAAALAQAGRLSDAERLWSKAERVIASIEARQRTKALAALTSSLARAKRFLEVERVIATLIYQWLDPWALTRMASALAQAQCWEVAERFWQEAKRVIFTIDYDERKEALTALTSSLTSALAQAQHWQDAERVIASIVDKDERAEPLAALASSLAQTQRWQDAERVIASIKSWQRQRTKALAALASSLAQAQHWQDAERVIASIVDEGLRTKALSILASSLAQAQHWQDAERIWQEGERAIATIDYDERAEALAALASALAQVACWQDAERVIASISNKYKRTKPLAALVSSLAQAGRWQDAEHVVASFHGPLSVLASALAQAQRWQDAERVIASIGDDYERVEALSALASSLVQAECWRDAERVSQEAERIIPTLFYEFQRPQALTTLASSLAQAEGWPEAERLRQKAERAIASVSDPWQKAKLLTTLASALAQAERWQDAERVVASISSDDSQRTEALTALASSLAQAGHVSDAEHLWQEAERVISTSFIFRTHEWAQAQALTALASSLAQAQRWQDTERLWQKSERIISTVANEEERAYQLTVLASSLAQAQRWQRAERLWQEAERILTPISYKSHLAYQLTVLASSLAQAQHWQDAERVITPIRDEAKRAEALTALASSMAQHNQHKEVVRLVQRWWRQADTRNEALSLLSIASDLILFRPDVGIAIHDAFAWVDDFLRG